MFIQTESTPNPATFEIPARSDRALEMGTADFFRPRSRQSAFGPGTRLFAVEGVTGVFFGT